MLKFIRSKGHHQQPSAERQKLQKELYAFRKVSLNNNFICHVNLKYVQYYKMYAHSSYKCGNNYFLSVNEKITEI